MAVEGPEAAEQDQLAVVEVEVVVQSPAEAFPKALVVVLALAVM